MKNRCTGSTGTLLFAAIVGATVLSALASPARAECVCRCVGGEMQPLCQSSIDLPPICPPTTCPISAPSIAPINPPTIPPIGTNACRQAKVCDTFGNCQWQQVGR